VRYVVVPSLMTVPVVMIVEAAKEDSTEAAPVTATYEVKYVVTNSVVLLEETVEVVVEVLT
jgi:hypothetical protein